MNKEALRKSYQAKRNALSEEQLEDLSLAIANRSLELPIWEETYYHIFLSIPEKKEVDTQFLLHILQGRDKSIVVSKSNFKDLSMQHYLLQENTTLVISAHGIPEPADGISIPSEQLQVIFVPLLVFDTTGNRIGYGKGFYDRFLQSCSKDAVFVGLSFFEAEECIASEETDIRLDYCITPKKVYHFQNKT